MLPGEVLVEAAQRLAGAVDHLLDGEVLARLRARPATRSRRRGSAGPGPRCAPGPSRVSGRRRGPAGGPGCPQAGWSFGSSRRHPPSVSGFRYLRAGLSPTRRSVRSISARRIRARRRSVAERSGAARSLQILRMLLSCAGMDAAARRPDDHRARTVARPLRRRHDPRRHRRRDGGLHAGRHLQRLRRDLSRWPTSRPWWLPPPRASSSPARRPSTSTATRGTGYQTLCFVDQTSHDMRIGWYTRHLSQDRAAGGGCRRGR